MNAVNYHHLSEQAIRSWFIAMSDSVQERDIESHMENVSKRVQVYGMPSKGVIGYHEWKARRYHEFFHDELLALNYSGIRIIRSSNKRISFATTETMVGNQGKLVILDKTIVLEYEDDGVWRSIEETVNKWRVKQLDLKKF